LPERAISAIALSMLAHALNPTVFPPRREVGARNRSTDVNGARGAVRSHSRRRQAGMRSATAATAVARPLPPLPASTEGTRSGKFEPKRVPEGSGGGMVAPSTEPPAAEDAVAVDPNGNALSLLVRTGFLSQDFKGCTLPLAQGFDRRHRRRNRGPSVLWRY
jgi:hypothetical protein